MKQEIYDIVWQIMKDHYFEGGDGGHAGDREYCEEKTNEIMAIINKNKG